MSRKKICLICFVSVLSMALTSTTSAQNQIPNWEFDQPMDLLSIWRIWTDDNFSSLSIVEDAALSGQYAMKVDFVPGASGEMLVFMSFLELKQGATYTISFMAKADAPRTVNVQLQARATSAQPWHVYWIETVDLTTEAQTYTYQYTHADATVGGTGVFDDDIDLHFNNAGSDIDVYYDHIWMGEGSPPIPIAPTSAHSPNPANGAIYTLTYATLGWTPSDKAVSHDVYMGENFDDVNDGTGDTFRVNQTGTFYVAGLTGWAYPDGLVPGTTYYWRIDEVNDADPNSPWKGQVWSFMIPSMKAYDPIPGDRSHFVDTENLILNWTTGLGAVFHTVYFSDNFDDVNDGVNGSQVGSTAYTPGPLEIEKTYYWRVDELETLGTH